MLDAELPTDRISTTGSAVIAGGVKVLVKVVSDLVLCKPKHGKRSVGGQARTFVDLPEVDTGVPRDCSDG